MPRTKPSQRTQRYFERACSVFLVLLVFVVSGCGTTSATTGVRHRSGNINPKYKDPGAISNTTTTEIESFDIKGACSKMVGKILQNPLIAGQARPPHVVIDARYFRNQTASRFNMNLLVDQFRADLINAANGRIIFVSREAAAMIEEERDLREIGEVGRGVTPPASVALGADYRLHGRLTDHSIVDEVSGKRDRYTQILFELVDIQTGQIVFSDYYDLKKEVLVPVVYR